MTQYEYKCMPAPKGIRISSSESEGKAVQEYADYINKGASDGWEFHSMEQISVTSVPPEPEAPPPPGCLGGLLIGLGLIPPPPKPVREKPTTNTYNMLVFRKAK